MSQGKLVAPALCISTSMPKSKKSQLLSLERTISFILAALDPLTFRDELDGNKILAFAKK